MPANICPKCGNSVMTYGQFRRTAEPYKVSPCESCGSMLRRSPKVYILLLVMGAILWIILAVTYPLLRDAQVPLVLILVMFILFSTGWVLLTNYLGWRLIGWVIADDTQKVDN